MLSLVRRKSDPALAPMPPEPELVIDVARARLALARKGRAAGPQAPAIRMALRAIEDALIAIDAIRVALGEASDLTVEALATGDEGRRALYAERYDDLRAAVNEACGATTKEEGCLTAHPKARIEVAMDEMGRSRHVVRGCDLSTGATGLDLPPPLEAFSSDDEIDAVATALMVAVQRLDRATQIFLDDAGALTATAGHL